VSRAPVVQVVGAPGAGKSLLITILAEALARRGHRAATAERIHHADGSIQGTVVAVAGGGRAIAEQVLDIEGLQVLVAQLDPRAEVILAERYDDPAVPTIIIDDAMQTSGETPAVPFEYLMNASIALLHPATIMDWFRAGPESADELAARIELLVLDREASETLALIEAGRNVAPEAPDAGAVGWLRRWARRHRGTSAGY